MKSFFHFGICIILALSLQSFPCVPQPPTADIALYLATPLKVGETACFVGSGVCPQGGTIIAYEWVFPPQAYYINRDTSSTPTCKFSPASPAGQSYQVKLRVRSSTGLWSSYETQLVSVAASEGTWYVSVDGNDNYNGKYSEHLSDANGPFRTIQVAIDSASEDDEIIVMSGATGSPAVYSEQLDMKGKSLSIRSDAPDNWEAVENTIIDAGRVGTAIVYCGNETGQLKGFTITGGAPAGEGLALHLTMDDEYAPGFDSSGKGRHGTLNGTEWTVDGHHGGVLSFNGDTDYIEILGYPGVVGRNPRTVSAWVKMADDSASPMTIASWGGSGDGQKWKIQINSSLRVNVGGGLILGQQNVTEGQWHHIAVVLEDDASPDVNKIKLYIDGLEPSTMVLDCDGSRPVNTFASGAVIIGACPDGSGYLNHYHGLLDDFRIYSRALSSHEIKELANYWTPVVYIPFDGDAGDLSGNDYHGTVHGNPTYSGGAIVLDGIDDYVVLPADIINPAAGPFSAFARVQGGANNVGIISQADDATGAGRYWLGINNGGLWTALRASGQSGLSYTSSTWNSAVWHHVGVVWDGSRRRLYLDGVQVAADVGSIGSLEACTGALLIGTNKTADPGYFWPGQIKDVQIYDRALTASEVHDLAGQLLAHWKLDGDVNDSAGGNSYHGVRHDTNQSGPLWQNGVAGKALTFDGVDDYIEIEGYKGISGGASRTCAAWIKADPSVDANQTILSWGEDATGKYWRFWLQKNVGVHGSISVGLNGGYYVAGSTDLRDGRWHHVAAVMEENANVQAIRLYVDGKEEPLSAVSPYPVQTGRTENVCIGSDADGTKFFSGIIDDVRIYNSALTDAQIQSLYRTRFADGGGIRGHGASPTIEKCIIKNNKSQVNGGGISRVNGMITDSFILNNESAADGGGLAECNGDIVNCVIAENRASIGGGIFICNGIIINNTVFNNEAIVSGGGLSNCSNVIINSIIWGNAPDALSECSIPSYSCFPGGSDSNTGQEPFFINHSNIAGYDGILGTKDDGLQLKGIASPCFNTGSDNVGIEVQVDIIGGVRRYNGNVDMGAYELRYVEVPNVIMMSRSAAENLLCCQIGLIPFVVEVYSEGPPDCVLDQYPYGENCFLELGSNVEIVASLAQDTASPTPNPMTWEVEPVLIGNGTTVTMTATTAADDSGVEYYFEELTGNSGGNNSGWQDSSTYVDYGLITGLQYSYRVKARDKSVNYNETEFSIEKSVVGASIDVLPPIPGRMNFEIFPYAASWNSLAMKAVSIGDSDVIEYYFQETSGNPGGSDSGWQISPEYRNSNLVEGYTYSYRVKARFKSAPQSETRWSYVCHVDFTPSMQLIDQIPPVPNPMTWSLAPIPGEAVRSLIMIADEASDNETQPDMIEYYFKCVNNAGFSSGWQRNLGFIAWQLNPAVEYVYKVKARDEAGNETDWSAVASAFIPEGIAQDIRFSLQDMGQGKIKIGYSTCTVDPMEIRSVALKISLENATIQNPSDVLFVDSRFNCFLDYAATVPGCTFGSGHPFAAVEQAGVPDFSSSGINEICINMTRFDEIGFARPGPHICANLITIQLHQDSPGPAVITISPDPLRKASFVSDDRLTNLPISTTVIFE